MIFLFLFLLHWLLSLSLTLFTSYLAATKLDYIADSKCINKITIMCHADAI
jgi:hypothetical protein